MSINFAMNVPECQACEDDVRELYTKPDLKTRIASSIARNSQVAAADFRSVMVHRS
jgi:hypothetical protein